MVNEVIDMISTRELNDDGNGDDGDDNFYDDNTPGTDFVNTLELQKRYFLRKIKGIEELHKRALESEKVVASGYCCINMPFGDLLCAFLTSF